MKLKFYKKLNQALTILFAVFAYTAQSQNQGLYVDTTMWTSSSTVAVKIKAKSFINVVGFQGSITFDKNSLQLSGNPAGNPTLVASNFTFGTSNAANGVITYLYADGTANHTLADATDVITINFNVINNPSATYNNNNICFSNTPTTIGIDTLTDFVNLTDLGTLYSPNLERHTCGYVSFARPPYLVYSGGNVTDTVTNRPAGTTYQWTLNGGNVAGTSISSYDNAPAGNVCLTITYPNGNSINCLSNITPVKFMSFTGKIINQKVSLNWATENEINNKGFDIEKSFDGVIFNKIGFVNSSKTSSYNYSYTDEYNVKTTWYRLKQIDNNGKYAYSNVIKISSNSKETITIYPNPTNNGKVSIVSDKITNVAVINVLGKTVLQQKFATVNQAQINTTTLEKGLYFLEITTTKGTETVKLIVE